ncbi:UbiX family flavin prenyltransferase [Cohaesibacter celericrescens]|uniref:UbiX family flavin prenyltransferase n=1 Tax=Cohaesibacter celericrescens TaxID=2067669 RepID=UPI0035654C5C
MREQSPSKIGIVISGASGSLLALQALRILKALTNKNPTLSSHLIITQGARRTAELELNASQRVELTAIADHIYDDNNLTATFASGSNPLSGLLVVPCSIRSLSAIAYSQTDRLSIRAADVMLKERRPLVLAVRETPFHAGHLQAMQLITQMGGIIAPPVPAFYLAPKSIDELAEQSAARLLALLGLDMGNWLKQWQPPSSD